MESNTTGSNSFSWPDVDWELLRGLRARFLQFDQPESNPAAQPDRADYWRTPAELENYNFTFAERIGWKWDTVLGELKTRGWAPPAGTVLDWGCGTGVAGRRVVEAWPDAVRPLWLWDRSSLARQFAERQARAAFPKLETRTVSTMETAADLLVISHVINELSNEALRRLLALVEQAQAVLWVEPGAAPVSRQLIAVREKLMGRFHPIAPCTHAMPCGMLSAENARHWCHHFAKIPGFVHTSPGWRRFSTMLEIDLCTLPFSFLVLDRRPAIAKLANPDGEASRVIGWPRSYKGYTKVLSCQRTGVAEVTILKRDAPDLLKELKKHPCPLYQWHREGEKVKGATPLL
jgi:hypothetical protein